uniref:Uncharacterized protein n=1 Tax=Sipha flava TaxID=143950 RepID=A0A2S2QCL0_9HEMI
MSTEQQTAFCVLRFSKCESVITVQLDFRRRDEIDAPTSQSIPRRYKLFEGTGCLCKGKSTGQPHVSVYLLESIIKYVLQENEIDYRLDIVRVTKKSSYRTSISKIN